MYVIAILNQKGGVGKTTIATHIAKALQLRGKDVLLVDSDPQGSSRDWGAANETQSVPVVGIDRPTLERDLKNIAKKEYVVIDGAPQAADLAVSAIKSADLIIIPVQPSPYDIWATSDLVDLIQQRIEITDNKLKAVFLINRVIKNTKISHEVEVALADYNLPVLDSKITQRVAYAMTASKGKTVLDLEDPNDAEAEINDLIEELMLKFLNQ